MEAPETFRVLVLDADGVIDRCRTIEEAREKYGPDVNLHVESDEEAEAAERAFAEV